MKRKISGRYYRGRLRIYPNFRFLFRKNEVMLIPTVRIYWMPLSGFPDIYVSLVWLNMSVNFYVYARYVYIAEYKDTFKID